MGKEITPTNDSKKSKWVNRNDETRRIIRMSTSSDTQFHLRGIDDLDEAWENIDTVFGKNNEIWAYHLENQLIYLNPNDFSCIEDYLSKFKTLRILLEDCKRYMKDDRCIYVTILPSRNWWPRWSLGKDGSHTW